MICGSEVNESCGVILKPPRLWRAAPPVCAGLLSAPRDATGVLAGLWFDESSPTHALQAEGSPGMPAAIPILLVTSSITEQPVKPMPTPRMLAAPQAIRFPACHAARPISLRSRPTTRSMSKVSFQMKFPTRSLWFRRLELSPQFQLVPAV